MSFPNDPSKPAKRPPGVRRAVRIPPSTALLERELDDEMRFHIEMRVADLIARGMTEAEARAEAERRFGDPNDLRDYFETIEVPNMRRMQWQEWLSDWTTGGLCADVRVALRSLLRAPSFSIAAILALGLGTGAAAGVFSMLEGVVLRPLPYAQPHRLVALWETNTPKSLDHEQLSPVNFVDYRALKGDFADIAGWWVPQLNLTDGATGDPIRVHAVETSRNLFRVLGVQPALGPGFGGDSSFNSKLQEVVISHRLWQSRYNSDAAIIGKPVTLNGSSYAVVGVMPAGFAFPHGTEVWQGLSWDFRQHSRAAHFVEAVGRLAPGATVEQANADLSALGARLGSEYAKTNGGWAARVVPMDQELEGSFRPALFSLLGAAGVLLLIACINVANLLLARGTARRREVAVRAAIGANRPRLIRLFLTESLVLAAIGSVLGFGFAVATVKGLIAWSPITIPRAADVGVNFTVLGFSTLVAMLTAVAFGLAPAIMTSRADLQDALKDGGKGASNAGRRTRSTLVVAEVALAVTLLSAAGLLIQSVSHLSHVGVGVDPASVVTVDLQLAGAGYPSYAQVDRFYANLAAALRTKRGVTAVGASNFLPLDAGWRLPFNRADIARAAKGEEPMAQHESVDEGYFETMHVPLLRGRNFTARDDSTSVPVVIVNEALAKQTWPGENPIGKRIVVQARNIGPLGSRIVPDSVSEVVGVVRDVKNTSLTAAAEPTIYFSVHQFPFRAMHLVVRGLGTLAQMQTTIRDAVRALDPALPLGEMQTMNRVLSASVDPPRFVMLLLGVFAALALSLAAVGIYGILTYVVSHRRKEIGIRLALGAQPSAMLRMVMREGVSLAVAGSAIGIVGAWAAGRSLSRFLYGVEPWDPITLGAVVAVVLAVATAACLMPGRRAAGEDPVSALRAD